MNAPARRGGFTLTEMMVAIAVAAILIGILLGVTSQLSSTVRSVNGKLDAFAAAQAAFDLMTERLSDATLNTYYDYDNAAAPTTYIRRSDLHFLVAQNAAVASVPAHPGSGQSVFFQVPAGYSNTPAYANTPGLLNACGYFVAFNANEAVPSIFPGPKHYRYRLMQAIQSTENNGIFGDIEGAAAENAPQWIAALGPSALPIAENVIALVIQPRQSATEEAARPLSPDYQYNSRQGLPVPANTLQSEQLPPILQLTMVAIDAGSAVRLEEGSTPPPVIEEALRGLFQAASRYEADLAKLEAALVAARVRYEVLTTSVTLRESKWSSLP